MKNDYGGMFEGFSGASDFEIVSRPKKRRQASNMGDGPSADNGGGSVLREDGSYVLREDGFRVQRETF